MDFDKAGGRARSRICWWRRSSLLVVLLFPPSGFAEDQIVNTGPVADDLLDEEGLDAPVVVPPDARSEPASQSGPPAVVGSAASALADTGSLRWEIPPIPWRASLTLSGGSSIPSEGASSTTLSQYFTASGGSYVWQPWFLKLNGAMSVSRSEDQSNDSSGESNSLTFGGGGVLLPATRYPFSFNGSLSKSGAKSTPDSGGGVTTESISNSIGLMQIYTPLSGGYSTTWTYNRLGLEGSSTAGNDSQDQLRVVSQNWGLSVAIPLRTENPQSLNFNTDFRTTENQPARAESRAGSLNVAHSIYLEDYVMTVSSNIAANATRETTASQNTRSSVSNIFSGLDWVPSDDYPLTIGGSLGLFNSKTGTGAGEFSVSTINGTGSARYPLDKQWTFLGQFNTAKTSTQGGGEGAESTLYALFGSANWSGEGVRAKWQAWDYSLGYGAQSGFTYLSVSQSRAASSAESRLTGSMNFGQGLGRSYPMAEGSPIVVAVSQAYSASAGTQSEEISQTLDHSATASWSPSTATARKQFSVSVSDGRSFGGASQTYQQASGNALYQTELSPYSSLSGTAGLNYSKQGGSTSSRKVLGANTGARYSHLRFANVSGLSYEARYDLIVRQFAEDSSVYQLEHMFSQGWSWRFGLLGWRIDHTMSKFGDQSGISQSLYLSVVRDFSGVL